MNEASLKIQKIWKNYRNKKQMIKLHDGMTLELLRNCIQHYLNTIAHEKNMNLLLKLKKIRMSNFPSYISENIVKFTIAKLYKIIPTWDTKSGDLAIINGIRIEVKGSLNLNKGPITFGPTEEWDRIYIVDGINMIKNQYKVYEIRLSNKSEKWKNIKINKKQTYYDQCIQKRRPRIIFKELKCQLSDDCRLIFDGILDDLIL